MSTSARWFQSECKKEKERRGCVPYWITSSNLTRTRIKASHQGKNKEGKKCLAGPRESKELIASALCGSQIQEGNRSGFRAMIVREALTDDHVYKGF